MAGFKPKSERMNRPDQEISQSPEDPTKTRLRLPRWKHQVSQPYSKISRKEPVTPLING